MNPDKTAIDATEKAKKIVRKFPQIEQAVLAPMLTLEIARALLSEAEGERWISVEERLPGPVENPEKFGSSDWGLYIVCVLAPNISERPIVIPATWTGKWRNDGGFDLTVTHWQPLPAPPKEKP